MKTNKKLTTLMFRIESYLKKIKINKLVILKEFYKDSDIFQILAK